MFHKEIETFLADDDEDDDDEEMDYINEISAWRLPMTIP